MLIYNNKADKFNKNFFKCKFLKRGFYMSETPENKSELDEYGVWIKSPAPAENNDEAQAPETVELPDDFSLDSIEIPEIPLEQTIGDDLEKSVDIEPEEIPAAEDIENDNTEETAIADEISKLNNFDADAPEETAPAEAEKAPEPAAEIPDGEIDLDSFLDSSPASTAQDGEVDLSAFMGDSGSSPDFGDGDIDLDAFMDGQSFEGEKEEQAEIEEADPLDIDLDFEEPVLEGAGPETQEAEDNSEDFDSLFENLSDETPELPELPELNQETTPAPQAASSGGSEEIDLSDFGFEDNSENLNPVLADEKEKKEPEGPVDYEINVDIEEDSEPQPEKKQETSASETSDDDIQVDISQDSEKAVQKEQETDLSSPDDSFDIDSIFNNIEDENSQTVDFSASGETEEADKAEEITEEPALPESTSAENISAESDSEIPLDDFMGEEGFTDGGPGVTGPYNEDGTLIQREEKKAPAMEEPEIVEETSAETFSAPDAFEAPESADLNEAIPQDVPEIAEEPEIEEETSADIIPEPDAFEAPEAADLSEDIPQDVPEIAEEPEIEEETSADIIPEPDAFEAPEAADLNEDIPQDVPEIAEEPEIEEETSADIIPEPDAFEAPEAADLNEDIPQDVPEIAEEPEIEEETSADIIPEPDAFEAPEAADSNEDIPQDVPEIAEEPEAAENENDLDVSSYLDDSPDYDMTGVTVTPEDLEKISEAPEEQTVPDSFEEEAASLSDEALEENPESEEKQTYTVFTFKENSNADTDSIEETAHDAQEIQQNEEEQPLEETMQTEDFQNEEKIDNSAILNKIAEELASLKSEINGLKDEFEELKKNGASSSQKTENQDIETPEIAAEEEPVEETAAETKEPDSDEKEDTGFFNDTDEDDTIALSGDELSNILNSAEFTSHDAEAISGEENETDTPAEEIEEPAETEEEAVSDTQPEEEITVPAAAENPEEPDAAVPEELSDSGIQEIENGAQTDSEPELEQPEESVSQEEAKATITDEDIPSPTLESLNIQNTEIKDEPLTEDNIEYLTSEVPEELREEEDENLETGISEHPVENVFANWEASPVPETDEQADQKPQESPADAPAEIKDRSSEIPADMKAEIKSVLAYMDQLLENLPEDKIAEFAQSEQFETYKKLFAELGLS